MILRSALVAATAGYLLAAVSLACAAASGEEDTLAGAAEKVRAAKIRDAALRSIDASVASLADRLATPEAQAVDMLENPGSHRVLAESRGLLRKKEHERLRDAFREQLEAFAEDRRADLPPGWVDEVMTHERSRVDATVDRLLDERFDALYEKARRRAVRVQRSHLEEIVYPDGADVEDLAGPADQFVRVRPRDIAGYVTTPNGQALVDDHLAAITADGALFEENEAILEEQQRAAVRDALVLLWRQLRLVHLAEPEDTRERSAIAARIVSDLEQLATEAEEVSGTSYGVFPSANSFAAKRAETLEVQGFERFLEEQLDPGAGCPALPEERVLRDVEPSFDKVPADLAAHERQLKQTLLGPTNQFVVDAYARLLDDVEAREEFRQRLQGMLREEAKVGRLLDGGFTTCLRKPLQKRREELAAEELAARLPAVENFSLELTDSQLRGIESSPLGALDAPALAGSEGLRMEESRARYESHMQQLIAEARDVLWRQKALTRSPERKGSFVERIEADSDRSEGRKASWQQAYETSLLDAWREVRTEELLKRSDGEPYRPDKYDRVLDPVSEIIEEIITLEFGRTVQAVGPPSETDTSKAESSQSMAGAAGSHGAAVGQDGAGGSGEAPGQQDEGKEDSQLASRQGEAKEEGSGGSGGSGGGAKPPSSEGEAPQEGSGGGGAGGGSGGSGGGGVDCTPLLARCNQANQVCYEALVGCRRDQATCNEGITRCHTAKELCEQLWRDSAELEARAPEHHHQRHRHHIRAVSSHLRSVSYDRRSLIRHAGDIEPFGLNADP